MPTMSSIGSNEPGRLNSSVVADGIPDCQAKQGTTGSVALGQRLSRS
jgi:hypothetical protein